VRLLLVEDEERLALFLAQGLRSAGFTVDTVGLIDEARAALATTRFDTVILDRGLPDGDGVAIINALRSRGDSTPVIMLTARDALGDRVGGLDAGADDYIVKPVELAELVARLRAVLRRPGGALGMVLKAGNVSFDTVARAVEVGGKPVLLTRRELALLEALLRRTGRVVGKSALEDNLYGFDGAGGANPLEACMSRLRKKLDAAGVDVELHTVRGVGYMLLEPAG
jgi:DNA-binding response OmpR family regulator